MNVEKKSHGIQASQDWAGVETRPLAAFLWPLRMTFDGAWTFGSGPMKGSRPATAGWNSKRRRKGKTVSDSVSCCYALLYWYNRPEFVDTCCCSFDGSMGNMVNQLLCYLCCLAEPKQEAKAKYLLGLGDTGLEFGVVWGQCWARHTSIECEAFRSIRKHKMKSYYVIFMICTTTEYYSVIFGNVL